MIDGIDYYPAKRKTKPTRWILWLLSCLFFVGYWYANLEKSPTKPAIIVIYEPKNNQQINQAPPTIAATQIKEAYEKPLEDLDEMIKNSPPKK